MAGGAIAYADGQLDATFNGGAPRVGTNEQGLAWSTQSVRVPAVVQADGRVVVAGQRAGAATLARFNADGTLDTTYGTGGFVIESLILFLWRGQNGKSKFNHYIVV